MERAARSAGRDPEKVQLVAVSKRHPVEAILEAYAAGQRDFGENYVQELVQKAEQLRGYPDIRWHLIGHLQSNKARFVAGWVHRIHTIDSLRLVSELAKRLRQRIQVEEASEEKSVLDVSAAKEPNSSDPLRLSGVLIEVHLSGEQSKSGCSEEEVEAIADAIDKEPQLQLRGLMTMPSYDADPETARPFFERLRGVQERLGGPVRVPELSMGMSHDAEVAIAEGATSVRIGTAIFGPRPQR